ARGPVQFALAARADIEKALKKYYGVGAETLEEMDQGATREREGRGERGEGSTEKVEPLGWEHFRKWHRSR
ncbi:MAG: hypothetical protein QXF24_03870, partial [Thermoproteota archaeon]